MLARRDDVARRAPAPRLRLELVDERRRHRPHRRGDRQSARLTGPAPCAAVASAAREGTASRGSVAVRVRGRPRARARRRGRAGGGAGVRDLRQRRARLRRHVGTSDPAARARPRGGRCRGSRREPRGAVGGGRPRHLRVDVLVRLVPGVQLGPTQPLRAAGGARRVVRRLPPRRRVRGAGRRARAARSSASPTGSRSSGRRSASRSRSRCTRSGSRATSPVATVAVVGTRRDRPARRAGAARRGRGPGRRARSRRRAPDARASARRRCHAPRRRPRRAARDRRPHGRPGRRRGDRGRRRARRRSARRSTCARRGGRVVLVGNVTPVAELPLQEVVTGELTLRRVVRVLGRARSGPSSCSRPARSTSTR